MVDTNRVKSYYIHMVLRTRGKGNERSREHAKATKATT